MALRVPTRTNVYDVRDYGAAGDGGTDDSAAINAAILAASAYRGRVLFSGGRTYRARNLDLRSYVTYDLDGSVVKLPDAAAANSDVFRTPNFDTLLGTNSTGGSYRWTIRDGYIDGNRANNATGRHAAAAYGVGTFKNLILHDAKGSGIWAEWNNGPTQLPYIGGAPGVADGDQTYVYDKVEIYDCEMRVPCTGVDVTVVGGITGVTNAVNPTITTAQYHLLRVGQAITIAGVAGAVGVNGAQTVASVPSATTFTVTAAAPGAYTGGGSITFQPKAALFHKWADSPYMRDLEIWQSAPGVIPASRGLMLGTGGVRGSNLHVYQNWATGIDVGPVSNSSQLHQVYVGGHDQGILIRQNYVTMSEWMINSGFNNSIGLDHQSPGGQNHYLGGRINGLPTGSVCVRIWNTSPFYITAMGVGDGGVNTSTLYVAPNGATGLHGWLYNAGNGVNAAPASLLNYAN